MKPWIHFLLLTAVIIITPLYAQRQQPLVITTVSPEKVPLTTITENKASTSCVFTSQFRCICGTTSCDIYNVTKTNADQPHLGYGDHNFVENPAIVYPNPVRDVLLIKTTDPITVIEILNLTGAVEKTMEYSDRMDVTDLTAGVHYIRIYFANKTVQVEKILVVR